MRNCFFIFLLFSKSLLFAQTIVNTYLIDLNKKIESTQIITALNQSSKEVFVCIAVDKSIKILKYNSAFFLSDEFDAPRKNSENRSLVGYSFSENGNPTLYWFSDEQKNFIVVEYFLKTKTFKELKFNFSYPNLTILQQYQNENSFNLLAIDNTNPTLVHYSFKGGNAEQKLFDFSEFTFRDSKTLPVSFQQILFENPMELLDKEDYNPLYKVASKTKMYLEKDHVILTFDQLLRNTQLFDIDLNSSEITEKKFNQPLASESLKSTNSFYQNRKLYQIGVNKDEFLFRIKNIDSDEILKDISISKEDTVSFKNTAFLSQINDNKPRELKNTVKFLRLLSNSNVGLSVFNTKKKYFITIGGFQFFESEESGFYTRNIYFESMWDEDYNFNKESFPPFAVDKIYSFMNFYKGVVFENIMTLDQDKILAYYDFQKKEYVMRKFTNDFWWEENEDPIINTPLFSNPMPLRKKGS